MSFIGSIIRRFMEREGRKHTLAEWPDVLAATQSDVLARLERGADTEKNRDLGRHTIGIERWSQRRLRVFLGEDLLLDEHDGYQPDAGLDMAALGGAFVATRQDTVALAREAGAAGIGDDQTVPHNDLGDMNVRTWLAYINGHAQRESGRIK